MSVHDDIAPPLCPGRLRIAATYHCFRSYGCVSRNHGDTRALPRMAHRHPAYDR